MIGRVIVRIIRCVVCGVLVVVVLCKGCHNMFVEVAVQSQKSQKRNQTEAERACGMCACRQARRGVGARGRASDSYAYGPTLFFDNEREKKEKKKKRRREVRKGYCIETSRQRLRTKRQWLRKKTNSERRERERKKGTRQILAQTR